MPDDFELDNSTDAGAETVPESLKKFVGEDGNVDVSRLSQSYLEMEAKSTKDSQARAEAERAYALLADAHRAAAGEEDLGEELSDKKPSARTAKSKAASSSPITDMVIEIAHPEVAINPETGDYNDPEFFSGLKKYVGTLPDAVKQSVGAGDVRTIDWAIRQFKATKARSSESRGKGKVLPGKGNFIESASPAGAKEGKVWTRAEIRNLLKKNPQEYAAKADEIQRAYAEDRVR